MTPAREGAATTAGEAAQPSRPARDAVAFLAVGSVCVIAGGFLPAVTAPVASEHTSWAAAYLVLVGGVAQIGLGVGQAMFTARRTAPVLAIQLVGWNLGNAFVLLGTLLALGALVDLGGALLLVALSFLARGLSRGAAPATGARRYARRGYQLLVLVVLVSIPVGLVLARVRG